MSRMAREWRPSTHTEGSSAPPSPSRGKAPPKMNGLLSRKQSGGDTPKLSSSTGISQRLAAKLAELLTRLQVGYHSLSTYAAAYDSVGTGLTQCDMCWPQNMDNTGAPTCFVLLLTGE